MSKESLLLKLKALAERGVDGEKVAAGEMLIRLCKKYNITPESLSEYDKEIRVFDIPLEQQKMFYQVVYSIIVAKSSYGVYKSKRKIGIKCTELEQAIIQETHDFHWDEYARQKKIFYRAYIQRHNIYPEVDPENRPEPTPLTDEDRRILEMMAVIERKTILKKINGSQDYEIE